MRGTPRGAHPSCKTGEQASTGLLVWPLEEFKGGSLSSQNTEAVGRSLPWKSRRLLGWLVALVVAPTGIVGSACVGIVSALIHPSWMTKPQQKSEVASECLALAKGSCCQQRVDLSRWWDGGTPLQRERPLQARWPHMKKPLMSIPQGAILLPFWLRLHPAPLFLPHPGEAERGGGVAMRQRR